MIVVDVEASGVDTRLCSLLSVGALDFDNPENQFYEECFAFRGAHIEKEALEVNGFVLQDIEPRGDSAAPFDQPKEKQTDREVVEAFLSWMKTCREWTLAGQNPSFDRDFLMETAHRYHINWTLAHRTIDLHSVAYAHFIREGKVIPRKSNHSDLSLNAILASQGLPQEPMPHHALTGAKLEAEAFSRLLFGRCLLPEFRGYPRR